MKRFIALLILTALAACSLSGCGIGGFYSVTVTGSADSLMRPLMPAYRAGTVVKIKAHPVTDVSLHVYVNGEEISMNHFDSDYWGFEFVMPKENVRIHLTYDPFYGKNDYTFKELRYGIDLLDEGIDMVSLRIENRSEGVNSFTETHYSYKQEDIESFLAIVDQDLTKRDETDAQSPTYVYQYGFYNTEQSDVSIIERLRFFDEFFHWNDFSTSASFRFKDANYVLPKIDSPDLVTYSFKYDGLSSDIRRYEDDFSIRFFLYDSFEFVEYKGDIPEGDPVFYLDSRYGKINLISATIFELDGVYYEIVKDAEYWAYTLHGLDKLL